LAEKTEKEGIIQSGMRAKEIASYFLKECRIEIGDPVPRIQGEQDLIRVTVQIRQNAGEIKVNLSDISIIVEEDRTRAKSTLTAAAAASGFRGGGEEVLPREIEIDWEKTGGKWKIKEARAIEVLR